MERTKRLQNDIVQDHNVNKKRKLQNENNYTNKSLFEILPNEILYEIFEYLDIYHIYNGFFNLNKRFKNFLRHFNLPLRINISTMSKTNFERYYKKIILPNKHRINILRLSSSFTVDIVLSPPRIIAQFFQLETLVLDNINQKSFDNISTDLIFLPKLHSLAVNFTEYIQCPTILFSKIFLLSQLKYCKIKYRQKDDYEPFFIHFTEYDRSPIEYLLIDTRFPFRSFDNLLSCLPRLRHLSINSLVESRYMAMEKKLPPVLLKHLKYVSLKLDSSGYNRLVDFIKTHFHHVEILHLSTKYDPAYIDAKQWEQLIISYIPNLRIFDIHHEDYAPRDQLTRHDLVNQFTSSFWIKKQWFFTYQYNRKEILNRGLFYSTNPYRRKNHTFYWELNQQTCSHLQENYDSVKHVYIDSKQATVNSVNYFSHATELTIEHYFKTTAGSSIPKTLNCVVPLEKLTKLTIQSYEFPFEQLVQLLRFTPNLYRLKFRLSPLYETNSKSMKQNGTFQYVSNTNKITNLDLQGDCTFEKIQLFVCLFPQLEYLKTGMNKKEINDIVHFLLSKNNIKTRCLFYLCISEIPKRCLRELNELIKSKKLLNDYFIKFINRDLYLWW